MVAVREAAVVDIHVQDELQQLVGFRRSVQE